MKRLLRSLLTDILRELRTFLTENEIHAGVVLSGTGHLTRANIKFASGMIDILRGNFTLLSLTGPVSDNFGADLKVSLVDVAYSF